jgi:hypothetical protein
MPSKKAVKSDHQTGIRERQRGGFPSPDEPKGDNINFDPALSFDLMMQRGVKEEEPSASKNMMGMMIVVGPLRRVCGGEDGLGGGSSYGQVDYGR